MRLEGAAASRRQLASLAGFLARSLAP